MFTFVISDSLLRKLKKIGKKEPLLAKRFRKKVTEIINHTQKSIHTYKNLRSLNMKFRLRIVPQCFFFYYFSYVTHIIIPFLSNIHVTISGEKIV
jgi:mRNA-degrading endonuclease RelE of RelBE toxin-antitoxin system